MRIALSAEGQWPSLRFLNADGREYTFLGTDSSDEPELRFRAGKNLDITGIFDANAMGASVTSLLDHKVQSSITAFSTSPWVLFNGPARGARLELGTPGPRIVFVDDNGNETAVLAREK